MVSPSLKKPGQDQIPVPPVLRLMIEPDRRPGVFVARPEGGAEILTRSRQPLVDGARCLLELGFDPDTMLTMRVQRASYPTFLEAFARRRRDSWSSWGSELAGLIEQRAISGSRS